MLLTQIIQLEYYSDGLDHEESNQASLGILLVILWIKFADGTIQNTASSSRADGIGNHQELSFVASPQEQLIIPLDSLSDLRSLSQQRM
jgi:hypothetical protein